MAPSPSMSSTINDVSTWTSKQWDQAEAKWAKEKERWADCQKQSGDQKLIGRKSWSFLASCMTRCAAASKSGYTRPPLPSALRCEGPYSSPDHCGPVQC